MLKQEKIKEYDDDPIIYCSKCYSIKIKHEDVTGLDYCEDCGCTDFKTTNIFEWEEMFRKMYGHKYVEANHDIKKSPMFMLSLGKLKSIVYKDTSWQELCKVLYPSFPEGLSRADSIVLLFAKIMQDNRLDDLRMELINQSYKK